jgi:hypothetical protein
MQFTLPGIKGIVIRNTNSELFNHAIVYVTIIFPGNRYPTKKEIVMERNEVIEVLDAGSEGPVIGPETFCCVMTFGFLRGHI